MLKYYILFIRIFCFIITASITNEAAAQDTNTIIKDGFDDGDFTKNPEWFGSPHDWIINDELKLQSTKKEVPGSSYITTQLPLANVYTWSFNVSIDTRPTTGNNAKIYLISSTKDLNNSPAGYYVDISSSDAISLRKRSKDGGKASTILTITTDLKNGINKEINVEYNSRMEWVIKIKNDDSDLLQTSEPDTEFVKGEYFGFLVTYTKTNSNKFSFNSVSIEYKNTPIVTPEPPDTPDNDAKPIYKYNDLIINEILFNPNPDGVPFIEIYNKSKADINLKYLKIATLKDNGDIKYAKNISKTDLILSPNNYLALTKSKEILMGEYYCQDPNKIFELSLPTITVTSGIIAIMQDDNILDRVSYNETMHFSMLNNFKGISLERINFNAPSQEPSSFHSASMTTGFATPGYKNSQFIDNGDHNITSNFKLSSKIIEPGVNGTNNVLEISYDMDSHDYLANINIFDHQGRLIKIICNNQLLGSSGSYFWDSLDENNQQVKQGLYIIKTQIFNTKGHIKNKNYTVVVAYR
ncbi:MAG: hypothetical protein ACQPRH_05475 [Solitalea-like symbiont of Tyrophagus putrescentiae]